MNPLSTSLFVKDFMAVIPTDNALKLQRMACLTLICLALGSQGWLSQGNPAKPPSPTHAEIFPFGPPSYSNDPEELQRLFKDLLNLADKNEVLPLRQQIALLPLPQAEAWTRRFIKESKRTAFWQEYAQVTATLPTDLPILLRGRLDNQQTQISITAFEAAQDHPVLEAFTERRVLYSVRFTVPGQQDGYHLAFFVYADGGFRYLGPLKSLWPRAPKQTVHD